MDRAEAEAIYDAGREGCVEFILDLAARVQQLDERLARLEAQTRQDSRTSSSRHRWIRRRHGRSVGRRPERRRRNWRDGRASSERPAGSLGIGVRVASCKSSRIRSMRSSITSGCVRRVRRAVRQGSGARSSGSVAARSPSCRRSALSGRSIARTSCGVGTVWRGPAPDCPTGSPTARSVRDCRRRS